MQRLDLSPPVLELLSAYPDLVGPPPWPAERTALGVGFACGPSWLPLIRGCLANLRLLAQEDGLTLRVQAVKEKHGHLRLSVAGGNDAVAALLERAEAASHWTCEGCGGPSELASHAGWLTTLCPVCRRDPAVPGLWRGRALGSGAERWAATGADLHARFARPGPSSAVVLEPPPEPPHGPPSLSELLRGEPPRGEAAGAGTGSGPSRLRSADADAAGRTAPETPGGQSAPVPAGREEGRADEATFADALVVRIHRRWGAETPLWLLARNPWLGGERPVDLLESEAGRARLADHVWAVEQGVCEGDPARR